MQKVLIELKNVWKTYEMGENIVHALRGVSFKIHQGEFVAVVGPSGSGKCVTGDTEIITETGDIETIENLKTNKNSGIMSLNWVNGKILPSLRTNFFERKVNHVLELKTTSGKKISATEEHPFFTLNEDGVIPIVAKDIKEGMFVATARRLDIQGEPQCLHASEKLKEDKSLIIYSSPSIVRSTFRELDVNRNEICKKLSVAPSTYYSWLNKNNIPLHTFMQVMEWYKGDFNKICPDISLTALSSNVIVTIPQYTSPELLELYGLIAGDGNLDPSGSRITNFDLCIQERIFELSKKLFAIQSKNYKKGRFDMNSRVLRSFFHLVFQVPLKKKARNIFLPSFIFKCPVNEISSFLGALFDCDAHVTKNGDIVITLASKKLILQVHTLLLRFGIIARYSEKLKKLPGRKRKRRYYALSISGRKNLENYDKQIGFTILHKAERLKSNFNKPENSNVDVIPCGMLIRKIRRDSGKTLPRKVHKVLWPYEIMKINPSRKKLQKIVQLLKNYSLDCKEIEKLIHMDIFWDKIKKVKKIYGPIKVYDITVPITHNFVANQFIIHNSTMMNIIGCLDIPTKGAVFLHDHNIAHLSESRLASIRGKTIGFIFQQFNLIPTLTALENVALPMLFQDTPAATRLARARALLTKFGLGDRTHHKPNELSGGQSQRVAISRSLANDPDVVLADEPTGNLDSKTGAEVMKTLADIHEKQGKTVVLVTHDLDLVHHAERVIHLKDGMVEKIVPGGKRKR